ncbi:MAG: CPBP family intramembrane metalloprotease [Acidobacteriota bacterium]|nr:CPBP family intramembrane metalloprotease [Acidobacteriota bacterium]
MSEQLVVLSDASRVDAPPDGTRASWRVRWFELVLLLSIAFGPYVFSSLHVLTTGQASTPYSQDSRWTMSFFHEVTALLLLGYILARRKVRFTDLGLRWSLADMTGGVGLAVGSYCAYVIGYFVVHAIQHAIFGAAHGGMTSQAIFGHPRISAVPFFLLSPFFEELIARAYLMTEIRELTGSPTLSIALSVAVQTTYHLYYGWVGALSLASMFLVFAVYYSMTRRATPIIVAHGAFDLFALFRLW